MIFPMAFILPFLALLITPIMSAPVIGPRHLTMHPLDAGLEKRSPLFWGQDHSGSSSATTKRSIPEYSRLVAREGAGSILKVRTFDDVGESVLAKRTEGLTIVRLARRSKISEGFKKFEQTVKKGFGEVVKFGAKIYATAAKAVGRVANFIPGVGKAVSAIANGVSRVANFVSDKIPVKLPAKLQKGVNVMNDIQDPFSLAKSKGAKVAGKVAKALGFKH